MFSDSCGGRPELGPPPDLPWTDQRLARAITAASLLLPTPAFIDSTEPLTDGESYLAGRLHQLQGNLH
jgi:hypothetical protein